MAFQRILAVTILTGSLVALSSSGALASKLATEPRDIREGKLVTPLYEGPKEVVTAPGERRPLESQTESQEPLMLDVIPSSHQEDLNRRVPTPSNRRNRTLDSILGAVAEV